MHCAEGKRTDSPASDKNLICRAVLVNKTQSIPQSRNLVRAFRRGIAGHFRRSLVDGDFFKNVGGQIGMAVPCANDFQYAFGVDHSRKTEETVATP